MKVIVEGRKPMPQWPKRFRCIHCGSIIEADKDDLKCVGRQYNETYYEYYCPVCMRTRSIGDTEFMKEE